MHGNREIHAPRAIVQRTSAISFSLYVTFHRERTRCSLCHSSLSLSLSLSSSSSSSSFSYSLLRPRALLAFLIRNLYFYREDSLCCVSSDSILNASKFVLHGDGPKKVSNCLYYILVCAHVCVTNSIMFHLDIVLNRIHFGTVRQFSFSSSLLR